MYINIAEKTTFQIKLNAYTDINVLKFIFYGTTNTLFIFIVERNHYVNIKFVRGDSLQGLRRLSRNASSVKASLDPKTPKTPSSPSFRFCLVCCRAYVNREIDNGRRGMPETFFCSPCCQLS